MGRVLLSYLRNLPATINELNPQPTRMARARSAGDPR